VPPNAPLTRSSLAHDLRKIGVGLGDTVLVHSSLRALGWVCGGAPTVVRALLDVLGPDGTLVVPAQTPENRDPSRWSHERVPAAWWPIIRAELPAFDPATTPCRESGLIAETVRTWPGAARSGHPQTSFAAVGRHAHHLMARHEITSELGTESPLGALHAMSASVLLLGVGYDRCTAFHLAEYRLPDLPRWPNRCVVMTPAGRRWITYSAATLDPSRFADLGAAFERNRPSVSTSTIGQATAKLLNIREAVDFAEEWLLSQRGGGRR
jgi:aminoglycoside 3-N-acetyltransferase